jgi:hypothetical protein
MLIIWIRKRKSDKRTCPKNDPVSFQKHAEDMKKFSSGHPNIEAANPRDIMIANGDVLAAVQKVKLIKYTQN